MTVLAHDPPYERHCDAVARVAVRGAHEAIEEMRHLVIWNRVHRAAENGFDVLRAGVIRAHNGLICRVRDTGFRAS